MDFDLKKTVEALLLSTAEPISIKSVVKIFKTYKEDLANANETSQEKDFVESKAEILIGQIDHNQIHSILIQIKDEAEVENKAYRLVEGRYGYQIVTAPQHAAFVRLLRGEPRPLRLSSAGLETLSIIAYRQPVTRGEIEAIRGVSTDGVLGKLIELELVYVRGRAELPGRPIQYGTSDKFLEFTGIKELSELPASDVLSNNQIDEWMLRSDKSEDEISDEDVGLSKVPKPDELPLNERFVEMDWRKENVESDAASSKIAD